MNIFKSLSGFFSALLMVSILVLGGCNAKEASVNGEVETDDTSGQGTLVFTADGEEFIREGFLTKDGWQLTFDQVYATIGHITAYQTDPPYDTDQGWDIEYQTKVEVDGVYTVNLADPESDPAVLVQLRDVPAGRYNALSWKMFRAAEGPSAGYTLLLVGQAEKDSTVIKFSLGFEQEVTCLGGEYIGDERKGILASGGTAGLEMTFHFDHLFGDGEEDLDDPLNLEALGFGPLAALAVNDVLETNMTALQDSLSREDYALLLSILTHLAHVGEGHCLARFIR